MDNYFEYIDVYFSMYFYIVSIHLSPFPSFYGRPGVPYEFCKRFWNIIAILYIRVDTFYNLCHIINESNTIGNPYVAGFAHFICP